MITPDYCRVMARYNGWQNAQVLDALGGASEAELTEDHGAFFGSILGTLNHVLWGDTLWMSRFDSSVQPLSVGIPDSPNLHGSLAEWATARGAMDDTIRSWAEALGEGDLEGDLAFFSAAAGKDVVKNKARCVAHFFNHQTHHRGQVHAMLTKTGRSAPTSDLFFMPEDA